MAKPYKFYGEWIDHHGKVITLDGIKCRLQCETYHQFYPYFEHVISVYAEPLNKKSKFYQKIKQLLGDDWSTDILNLDIEVQNDVWNQCLNQEPQGHLVRG